MKPEVRAAKEQDSRKARPGGEGNAIRTGHSSEKGGSA